VLIAGREMLAALMATGSGGRGVLTVAAVRLATAGVSTAMGAVFLLIHLRSSRANPASHFDEIADAYDVQIPESRRHDLLVRKTRPDARSAAQRGVGVRASTSVRTRRLRDRDADARFDVVGIDQSEAQVRSPAATRERFIVKVGSVLDIPAADEAFDFAYVINVLHHLSSSKSSAALQGDPPRSQAGGHSLRARDQHAKRPVSVYMGYVFPSLNCIDEGIERWLLPNHMDEYTDATALDVRYFTFLRSSSRRQSCGCSGPWSGCSRPPPFVSTPRIHGGTPQTVGPAVTMTPCRSRSPSSECD